MENATVRTLIGHELKQLTFGWTDYTLFTGLLGISVLIGVYFGCFEKKQDNTTEYLLGGKTMSCFPISMSLIASHISGVSLLGIPSEVYQFGTQYAACIFTSFLSCGLISLIYMPVFHQLQLTSTFEYLELRFARPVRMLASFLYTLSLVIYIPLIIYVPALAFSQATAINLHLITPIICIVCIFYTTIALSSSTWEEHTWRHIYNFWCTRFFFLPLTVVCLIKQLNTVVCVTLLRTYLHGLIWYWGMCMYDENDFQGGLKAVVWADTVQMLVTMGSLLAVVILGTMAVGGVSRTWEIAKEGGRIQFWNMDPSIFARNSFWGMSIGMTMTWLSGLGISQVSMQRFLAVPTIAEANKTIAVMAVVMVAVKWVSVFTGLTMYARYNSCDPISAHVIARSDQMLPYYVLDVAEGVPGLPGLFLAGLVSAGLSTMSAGLNTAAGTIYEDFIDHWLPESSNKESRAANIMKVTVVILGLICVMLVFVVDQLGDIFQVSLSLTGITAGAMLGLFTLGMLIPWATTKGAVVGGLVSMVFMVWIIVGAQINMAQRKLVFNPLPSSTRDCLKVESLFNSTTSEPPAFVDPDDKPFVLYTISFMYYTLVGFVIVMVIGTICSFLFGAQSLDEIDPNHYPPIVKRFLPRKKYTEVSLHTVPTAIVTNPEKEKLNS